MDELHAAIAAYLRDQRPVVGEPSPRMPRACVCRLCGQEYTDGAEGFHLNELVAAGLCGFCMVYEVRRSPTGLATDWDTTTAKRRRYVTPHCHICGQPITAGAGRLDIEQLRAERACAEHAAMS